MSDFSLEQPWFDPQAIARTVDQGIAKFSQDGGRPTVNNIATTPYFSPLAANPSLSTVVLTQSLGHLIVAHVADALVGAQKSPHLKFTDIGDRVADITIETSAQGSQVLEVHLVDPMLILLRSGFITVDPAGTGELYPPIELDFPPHNVSDSLTNTQRELLSPFPITWRLAAVRFETVTDSSDANLVLTFEDKIVTVLREVDATLGGVKLSHPSQTLADFMGSLVGAAAKVSNTQIDVDFLIDPNPKDDPNAVLSNAAHTRRNKLPRARPSSANVNIGNLLGNFPSLTAVETSISAILGTLGGPSEAGAAGGESGVDAPTGTLGPQGPTSTVP